MVQAIEDAGFDAECVSEKTNSAHDQNNLRTINSDDHISNSDNRNEIDERRRRSEHLLLQELHALRWSIFFTVPLFFIAMVLPMLGGDQIRSFLALPVGIKNVLMFHLGEVLQWILATPVQFWIGARFHIGAYKSLKRGSSNMDVLVSLGTNVSYFYSVFSILRHAIHLDPNMNTGQFFETSAMLITFILLGKYLERRAKGKTSEAITKLLELAPSEAIVVELFDEEVSSPLVDSDSSSTVSRLDGNSVDSTSVRKDEIVNGQHSNHVYKHEFHSTEHESNLVDGSCVREEWS